MRDEHLFETLDGARRKILDHARVVGTEKVELGAALARVLRQRVVSDIDYPRADVSSMDGYCLDSRDTAAASEASPVTLPVVGKSTPGAEPPALKRGSCVLITTGAPLAAGADAVVKYEDVVEDRGGRSGGGRDVLREGAPAASEEEVARVIVKGPVQPGACIRKKGEVAAEGSTVLESGTVITPQVLGIMASFARGPYEVSRRLRAGVFATGDELAAPDAELSRYAIRDSNSPTMAGMLEEAGCEVIRAGRSADSEAGIAADLERYGDCDVVMISGGVSGGRFDFVPACLEGIGARIILRGVKMRPGKPVLFAARGETAYFGVPGNPVSAVVSFHLLFRPAILAMTGRSDYLPVSLRARCTGAFVRKPPYMNFAPGILLSDLTVRPTRFLGSGDIMSLAEANALVCVPEDVDEISAGEEAEVYPLGWFKTGGA